MDLQTLANLAEIIGVLAVAGGFIFGAVQLLHLRRQRSDLAAMELARLWHEPQFSRALRMILELPSGISGKELHRRGPELVEAAMQVAHRLETVGLMVYRRVVPLEVVWDLMGGMTMSAWDRLKGWIDDTRAEQQNEKFAEWIEWLVNQLSTQVSVSTPAHLREMDWKP